MQSETLYVIGKYVTEKLCKHQITLHVQIVGKVEKNATNECGLKMV